MGSDFLTGMSSQSYYRCITVFKIMLRYNEVLDFLESPNADDARSKRLKISHLDEIGLYTTTMEEISVLSRAARNFMKNWIKPVSFLAHTFCTSTKIFLVELMAVSIDHRTNSTLEYVGFCTRLFHILARQALQCCLYFSAVCGCVDMRNGRR